MVAGFLPMLIPFLNSITFLGVNRSILHLAIGCRRRKFSLYDSFLVAFLFGVISSRYLSIKFPKVIEALSLKSSYDSFSIFSSVSFAYCVALPFVKKTLLMDWWLRLINALHFPLFILKTELKISHFLCPRCTHSAHTFRATLKKWTDCLCFLKSLWGVLLLGAWIKLPENLTFFIV